MADHSEYLEYRCADDLYQRLQTGYDSRGKELRFFGVVSTLLILWLTREHAWADQFAFVALLWTVVLGFRTFIESNNLNLLMQQIKLSQTIR